MKRQFDVVCVILGLLALALPLVLLWLAVIIQGGRPGLFCQIRVGQFGKDFILMKFRTMTVVANATRGIFEPGNRARITPVGRFLRKTKLDELPQLLNVLKGDMSLVGPRPEVRRWVEAYPERWVKILSVRPGITDPASIEFRDEESQLASAADPEAHYRTVILPRKLDLYEQYIDTRSLGKDVGILFRTVAALFNR